MTKGQVYFLFLCLLTTLSPWFPSKAQEKLRSGEKITIPSFRLQLTDSSLMVSDAPTDKKFIALVYFSPDCGHCIEMTEAIVQKADSLTNTLIILVAYKPLDELQRFSERFELVRFPGIRVGRDLSYAMVPYYQIAYTPFLALYGADRKLIRSWRSPEQTFRVEELLSVIYSK